MQFGLQPIVRMSRFGAGPIWRMRQSTWRFSEASTSGRGSTQS